jgi:predicted acyl esterase
MPFKAGQTPLAAVPNLERVLMRYQNFTGLDDWWTQEVLDQKSRLDRYADVPTVFSTGWYDCFVAEVTWQFAEMARRSRSPQRLIVGPWNHGGMRGGASSFGEVEYGRDAAWGAAIYNAERLRWFERWLRDVDTGVEHDDPVRVFVMGGGSGARTRDGKLDHGGAWRRAQTWPPRESVRTPYYLAPGGRLASSPDPTHACVSWTHDPDHPVPTIGAAVAAFFEWIPVPDGVDTAYLHGRARMRAILPDGPMHQRERPELLGCRTPFPLLAQRADVQVFETETLVADVTLVGPIEVKLFVSTSALDTDFTAKLIDVHPPSRDFPEGFHLGLGETILRLRFRDGVKREQEVVPGVVYAITLELPPTANRCLAGHRIRLDIASSSFPHFDVNPGTGEPLGRHTHKRKALNTIHLGPAHPSAVILPVMPA